MKKLSVIVAFIAMTACSAKSERYDRIMESCVSSAMEYYHSESEVREV